MERLDPVFFHILNVFFFFFMITYFDTAKPGTMFKSFKCQLLVVYHKNFIIYVLLHC